jgi:CheY-like chemotaxis protein
MSDDNLNLATIMPGQPKILLLDEDQDFLDLYREMLSQHLPSLPEVRAANSGSRALSLLESEQFNLLITELNLSHMDGLQVLTIARRKHPQLRLVVLTAIRDEQFRTRSYALGVDQYWIKPETDQEMGLFMESIESLIGREAHGGFRGVQSKSLVDIIQLECLSQSSVMLKIINGVTEGKIYIQNGEVTDAEMPGMSAEPAFQRILSWKTGSFEILPPDPSRVRTIFTSYQGLLLNTAQAIDEAASASESASAEVTPADHNSPNPNPAAPANLSPQLVEVSQMEGVEFVLALGGEKAGAQNSWGLDNPKPVVEFTRQALQNFRDLGERLQVGELQQIFGTGPQRKVAVASCGKSDLCVGFPPALPTEQVNDSFKSILTKWAS